MDIIHHTKYKEIHGEDETVVMDFGEHQKLHKRLRREGKCTISIDELGKISRKAGERLPSRKLTRRLNKQTPEYKLGQKQYRKNAIERIISDIAVGTNVLLREDIMHNKNTKTISVSTFFRGNHGVKLLVVDLQ